MCVGLKPARHIRSGVCTHFMSNLSDALVSYISVLLMALAELTMALAELTASSLAPSPQCVLWVGSDKKMG